MPRLEWDTIGDRFFETGIDRGVLFVDSNDGVPWSGLISLAESPEGSDTNSFFYDGFNYLNVVTRETFKGTLTAYYSPEEFDQCDGTLTLAQGFSARQQDRRPFNLSYRTKLGNDTNGEDHGYKIHLLYNILAAPTSPTFSTINDSISANSLSWDLIAKPIVIPNGAPSTHFVINSTQLDSAALEAIERILYGSDEENARLPTPTEIVDIINSFEGLVIIDNGDGTWTAIGSEPYLLPGDPFTLNADSVIDNGSGSFTASSLEA